MSSLNIATDIPSQIDTLEKNAAWAGLALANINPTLLAVEGQGYEERVSSAGIFYVQASNKYRLLIRHSFEVSPDYLAGGQKLWNYVQPLSGTAIPALFMSN